MQNSVFRACIPAVQGSADNPDAALTSLSLSCGVSPQGCFPSPSGTCITGAVGDLPVAGPDTYYFAMSSGLYCCLVGETMVSLWGGEEKLASDVIEGDFLVGVDDQGIERPQRAYNLQTYNKDCMKITLRNSDFTCSLSHAVMNAERQWIPATSVIAGETHLLGSKGETFLVTNVQYAGQFLVYAWDTDPDQNFYAAGLLQATPVIKATVVSPN